MSATQHNRDGQRFPFFMVGKAATRRIREHFGTEECSLRATTALAIYVALVELANDARSDETAKPRKIVGDYAGVGMKVVSQYQEELERAGVISIERRVVEGVNLPNIVTIIDVEPHSEDGAPTPPPPASRPEVEAPGTNGSGPDDSPIQEGSQEAPHGATAPARAGAQGALLPGLEKTTRPGTRSSRRPDPDAVPDDFPAELLPLLIDVEAILRRTAEARGQGRPVARAAIARALMVPTRRQKPAVKVADAVERWLCFGKGASKPCRDVVARWVDWLDEEPDAPPAGAALVALPGGRGPGGAEGERVARQMRRAAVARGEAG